MTAKRPELNRRSSSPSSRKTGGATRPHGHIRPLLDNAVTAAKVDRPGGKPGKSMRSPTGNPSIGNGKKTPIQSLKRVTGVPFNRNGRKRQTAMRPLSTKPAAPKQTDHAHVAGGETEESFVLSAAAAGESRHEGERQDPTPPLFDHSPLMNAEEFPPPVQKHSSASPEYLLPTSEAPAAYTKNDAMIYPHIAYASSPNRLLVRVTVVEEVWEVQWEQRVRIKWSRPWARVDIEVRMSATELRYDQSGSTLWIEGEMIVTGTGTALGDAVVRHETVLLPFSATVLRPAATASPQKNVPPLSLPPYPEERWAEAGDWKMTWLSNPLAACSSNREQEGLILICGRVWWFRKQFLPLSGPESGAPLWTARS